MTLAELNAADRAQFVAALGATFEASPWVPERAWEKRPFGSVDELLEAMKAVVAAAPRDEQLALLRAHPDLGTRADLSSASAGEQASVGLDRLDRARAERLLSLNREYQQKFGYPFIFAVRHRTTSEILEALEARLRRSPGEELAEALRQVYRIAQFRLAAAIR